MTAAVPVAPELDAPQQRQLVAALRRRLQLGGGPEIALIETHISYVLIAHGRAYKFKKVLKLDVLDFSTCALRRHDCLEELRLNRRFAPELYLDVVAVTGTVEAPELGGDAAILDHVLVMREFAQSGLWDRMAARSELTGAHVDALLLRIVESHDQAAVAAAGGRLGSPEQVRRPMVQDLQALERSLTSPAQRRRLARLRAWEEATFQALRPVFEQRRSRGRVRECHGDLHLGNVAQIAGRPVLFDCIAFSEELRWIDVMSDLAFMAMDLEYHGLARLARRLVNGYFELSGDYAGARVLKYYVVHRALVRAKVAAVRAEQGDALGRAQMSRHLALAVRCLRQTALKVMITHGPSGSGKTTLTQALVEASGAIRIRSDVERKRRAGLNPLQRGGLASPSPLYDTRATEATYARLRAAATDVVRGGCCAVLDATFLARAQRDAARALAAGLAAQFVILEFDAPLPVLQERIRRRAQAGNDASDADLAVLAEQLRTAQPLSNDERAAVVECRPDVAAGEPLAAHRAPPSADGG